MKPYYQDDLVTLYHGDCRDVWLEIRQDVRDACSVIDPPYDHPTLYQWARAIRHLSWTSLVFTDPKRLGDVVGMFGPPIWVFTWDTMSPWNIGLNKPLNQTRFCLWYGDAEQYNRDAELWGEPPPARNHPSTKQVPLDGRRLTDLWRESLRWVHNPSAGTGSAGTERFSKRQGDASMRHAKPVGWLKCLLGNTSSGMVFDPFCGSGTSLRAAKDIGRKAIGIEIDEHCCELTAQRMAQGSLSEMFR